MILKLLILLVLGSTVYCQFAFPKKVWIYWDQPIQKAPYIVRLCYEKFVSVCKKQDWKLTLLSRQNLHQHVKNYPERIEQVYKKANNSNKPNFSDLVRLSVLEDNGGVYFDISTMLIYGLEWLQKIDETPHLLTNKKPNSHPDIIIPYINYYQSTSQRRGQQGTIFNQQPGYEGWFIATKAGAPVIQKWQQMFSYFYQRKQPENQLIYLRDDIFYRSIERGSYLTINKAMYYLLQRKQFELDQGVGLFSKRQRAFQHYNLWGFHGQFGPFVFYLNAIPDKKKALFEMTLQEITQQYFQIKFFIKLTGGQRPIVQKIFNFQIQLAKKDSNFQKFIQSLPSPDQCKDIVFPVEGSIVSKLIQDNVLARQLKLFSITKQQRDRWHKYCNRSIQQYQSKNAGILDTYFKYQDMFLKQPNNGRTVKTQYNLWYEKDLGIYQKIDLYYQANMLAIALFKRLALSMIKGLLFLAFFVAITQKIIRTQNYQTFVHINENKSRVQSQNYKSKMLIFLYFVTNVFIMQYFQLYDKFGDIHSDTQLMFLILWTMWLRYKMTKSLPEEASIFLGLRFKECQMIFDPITFFYFGKQLLNWTQVRQNNLFPDNIVISLIGIYLLRIAQIKYSKNPNIVLRYILKMKRYHPRVLVAFLFICQLTNFRFITLGDRYMVRFLPFFMKLYVAVLFIAIAVEIIKQIGLNIKQTQFKKKNRLIASIITSSLQMIALAVTWNFAYRIQFDFDYALDYWRRVEIQRFIVGYFIVFSLSLPKSPQLSQKKDNTKSFISLFWIAQALITLIIPLIYPYILTYHTNQIRNYVNQNYRWTLYYLIVIMITKRYQLYHLYSNQQYYRNANLSQNQNITQDEFQNVSGNQSDESK